MKRLVFKDMLVASTRERKGRRIEFHPKLTVFKGTNEAGKSCLMKTIYQTFGTIPPLLPTKWRDADPKAAIRFEVDGEAFRILHDGRHFTMFDSLGKKIKTFRSVTKDLSPYFAKLFGFHLRLQLQSGEGEAQATPAFLFLPFYIDQDKSWVSQGASFDRLTQFSGSRFKDAIEYHTGIRPNEYYSAKSALSIAKNELRPLQERRSILQGVVHDLELRLAQVQFDTSLDSYQKEIEHLLVECNKLREEEEAMKKGLVSWHNRRIEVSSQIAIAKRAAGELAKDYDYAVDMPIEAEVECPTCGALYDNAFKERFAIADDEDRCRELLVELEDELVDIDAEIGDLHVKHVRKASDLAKLQESLQAKQGDVTLQELLENEGKKEASRLLAAEIRQVNQQVGAVDERISDATNRMKKATNPERSKEILAEYSTRMQKYLFALDLHDMPTVVLKRVDVKMPGGGSVRPRALLAYYYSILHTINRFSSSTFCPILIDSPKQQDQDARNWENMLTLIRDEQPSGSQVVLAMVDQGNVILDGIIHEFPTKRGILKEEEYESVMAEMRPLLNASMQD